MNFVRLTLYSIAFNTANLWKKFKLNNTGNKGIFLLIHILFVVK